MEFRKMVMITLYARQKKRHRYKEQTIWLCGWSRRWDVLREQHRNMHIIQGETDHQTRLDVWDKCSGLVHWEDPEGSGREGGGRGGLVWGIHVNPWLIHVNVWQKPLQYCKVISLQLIKINEKKIRTGRAEGQSLSGWHKPPLISTFMVQSLNLLQTHLIMSSNNQCFPCYLQTIVRSPS